MADSKRCRSGDDFAEFYKDVGRPLQLHLLPSSHHHLPSSHLSVMLPLLLPSLLSVASVARSAAVGYSNSSIDGYVAFESPLAYQGVLDNIGLANSSSNWTQGALPVSLPSSL